MFPLMFFELLQWEKQAELSTCCAFPRMSNIAHQCLSICSIHFIIWDDYHRVDAWAVTVWLEMNISNHEVETQLVCDPAVLGLMHPPLSDTVAGAHPQRVACSVPV